MNSILVILLSLVTVSLSAKFTINNVFLTTNKWILNIGTEGDVHEQIILNPNGRVYKSDNRTLFDNSSWKFDSVQQWVNIYTQSGVC